MSEHVSRPVPVLRGTRVTLRPPRPADADAVRRIGVHPEIFRLFGEETGVSWRELTTTEADAVVASLAPNRERVDWVVDAGAGFIGSAGLHSFDEAEGTAAYAIGMLEPGALGHGLGTEVTRLLVAYAFDELELSALTVRVLEFNTRAIGCYAKSGFCYERREPHAARLDGVWHADVIMRLDADRYRELAPTWSAFAEPPLT